jgi:hypothetical protein
MVEGGRVLAGRERNRHRTSRLAGYFLYHENKEASRIGIFLDIEFEFPVK